METSKNTLKDTASRLTEGYNKFIDRTKESLDNISTDKASSALHQAMDKAKNKAVELGELTITEADNISRYVRQDVHDAADYIKTEKRELADWLRLDLLLIKKNILKNFESLVDQMKFELKHTSKNIKRSLTWHTGEITGIGTLECDHCHELIHFHKAGHIPPCPKCHKTNYHRRWHK
ncbi:MAG: zinc ribbon-containing protein [Gammaproteobacteria bacterium]|nr:zinc ribbon-containing protein [Gammaproteobacteria bacterium]